MIRIVRTALTALQVVIEAIFSPVTIFVVLIASGASSVVYGVYLLTGEGWAFLAAGPFLLLLAALIAKGMNNG